MARLRRSVVATVALLFVAGIVGYGASVGAAGSAATADITLPGITTTGGPHPPGPNCSRTYVPGLTALTDLGKGRYNGYQGGLYPHGANKPPSKYLKAGIAATARIRPLGAGGIPRRSGRIVLLTIGMSNVYDESLAFIHEAGVDHAALNPHLTIVNGAKSNYDAVRVTQNQAAYLAIVNSDLSSAGVTADQVQAVWLKEAIENPHQPFPADSQELETDLNTIVAMLSSQFHNLRAIYISSRIYAGYAVSTINPEPYAYESGFAVKWAVAKRMAHPKKRPWVAWGPYLWADGLHARSDGLTWSCSDFEPDGTHPSGLGAEKVAGMLMRFFTTSKTTRTWFDKPRPRG